VGVGNGEQATGNSFTFIFSVFLYSNKSECKFFKPQTLISVHFLWEKKPESIDKYVFYRYSASPTYERVERTAPNPLPRLRGYGVHTSCMQKQNRRRSP
jgi:hypothetical protein